MEMPNVNRTVEKSGDFEDQFFGIGDMALVMEILRSKLYTDPIKTLTQEIASNARDAHREVGKGNIPIEVFLPSALNPNFYVRDFGPGITPDRMVNVFIRYGCSTKRTDNTQTGGFGIGAKSPFSYVDQFSVESITPNEQGQLVKRTYIAYIDETNKGKLSLVMTEDTTEPQGTKITVPVKPNDMRDFAENINRACSYWDVQPTVLNHVDFKWECDESFKIRGKQERFWFHSQEETIALIDGIQYPLDFGKIIGGYYYDDMLVKHGLTKQDHKAIMNAARYGLSLKFNVGEITITANREEFENKDNNVKAIIALAKESLNRLNLIISEDIANAPTCLEACHLLRTPYYTAIRKIFGMNFDFSSSDVAKATDFEKSLVHSSGARVKTGIRLCRGLKAVVYSVRKGFNRSLFGDGAPKKVKDDTQSEIVKFTSQFVTLDAKCVNLRRDDDKNIKPRIMDYLHAHPDVASVSLLDYDDSTVSITAANATTWQQEALAWLDANLNPALFGIGKLSDLPIKPKEKKPRAPRIPGQRKSALGMIQQYDGHGYWGDVALPTEDTIVCVTTGRASATLFGKKLVDKEIGVDDISGFYRFVNKVKDGMKICKVHPKNIGRLPANFISAEKFVTDYVASIASLLPELDAQHALYNEVDKASYYSTIGNLRERFGRKSLDGLSSNSPLHEVIKLCNKKVGFEGRETWDLVRSLSIVLRNRALPAELQVLVEMKESTSNTITKAAEEIMVRYPLLPSLRDHVEMKDIIAYMNMVEDVIASAPMMTDGGIPAGEAEKSSVCA